MSFIINPFRFGPSFSAGALDAYTTNLWAAWGITRMRDSTTYTGPAIRVRRSSDNAEMDVYFSAGATTLDSGAMVAWGGASSVYVKTFYDQSGNSRDATQATSGLQPRIVNAGVYDGKVIFDGSDDYLATTAGPTSTGVTCAMKFKYNRSSTSEIPVGQYVGVVSGHNSWFVNHDASNQHVMYETNGTSYDSLFLVTANTALGVQAYRYDLSQATKAARMRLWHGGSEQVQSNGLPVGTPSFTSFTSDPIGIAASGSGGAPALMDFYHAAYYDAALAPATIVLIDAALA